jgi:hypothetical protein
MIVIALLIFAGPGFHWPNQGLPEHLAAPDLTCAVSSLRYGAMSPCKQDEVHLILRVRTAQHDSAIP